MPADRFSAPEILALHGPDAVFGSHGGACAGTLQRARMLAWIPLLVAAGFALPVHAQTPGDGPAATRPMAVPGAAAPERDTVERAISAVQAGQGDVTGASVPAAQAGDQRLAPPGVVQDAVPEPTPEATPGGPAWAAAMDDFISTALVEDPSVQRAQANIAAAQDGVAAAKWQFGPTPSFSREPGGSSSGQYVNVIRVQQPLYTGGALSANLRSARISEQGSQQELAATRMQLRINLVSAWADWVKASGRADSLEALTQQHEELLAMIQRRTDAGAAPLADAALARSRLSAVKAELAQARLEAALQREQLQRLARRPVEPSLGHALDGRLPAPPALSEVLDRIQMSPDMALARAGVALAHEELAKAKAGLLPTLSLRMDHQSGAVRDQRIGLVMQASLGGGLASLASVNAARNRIQAAQAAVAATEQALYNRYQLEYTRYAAASASAGSAAQTSEASNDVLASYRRQFAAGKRAWLDLLNMVRENHAARQSLRDALIDERAGLYRLQVLLDRPPAPAAL